MQFFVTQDVIPSGLFRGRLGLQSLLKDLLRVWSVVRENENGTGPLGDKQGVQSRLDKEGDPLEGTGNPNWDIVMVGTGEVRVVLTLNCQ